MMIFSQQQIIKMNKTQAKCRLSNEWGNMIGGMADTQHCNSLIGKDTGYKAGDNCVILQSPYG